MNDILLELQTEELPSLFLLKANETLKDITENFLKEKNIEANHLMIKVFTTPRRIGILIENLPDYNKKEEILVIGPPYDACYKDGHPTKALEAFLKKNDASLEEAFKYEKQGGVYIAIKKQVGGISIEELFKEFPDFVIKSLTYKKMMRWHNSFVKFPRPIRDIALLLNNKPIPPYKNTSRGHRFLSTEFVIENAKSYEELLKKHFVVPAFKERRNIILDLVLSKAKELNISPEYEEELIDEITNLVEYPYLVVGEFEKEFLSLPDVVIKTVLAHHQKFITTKKESITNIFFGISNIEDKKGYIKDGYQKVVRARLRDAVFFYNEDLKKPFEFFVEELKGIMFHHKLGTMFDKTMRHVALGEYLSLAFNIKKDVFLKACKLSLFDIATNMVKEFDELQGYMGMIYTKAKNEEEELSKALLEQYMPDKIEGTPSTKTGVLLGIIVKSDNIVSLIGAHEIPKGTSDAYGIKRNIYGIIKTILEHDIDIDLEGLFQKVYELLENKSKLLNYEEIITHIKNLFRARLNTYFEEYPYDIVRAVLEVEDPLRVKTIKNKVELLSSNRDIVENIARVYKRIRKILPKDFTPKDIKVELFESDLEKELYKFLENLQKELSKEFLECINDNKKIVDEFFDKILVMAENMDIRNNRLSLLYNVYKSLKNIADFEHIVIKEA
ncbi:glycine--tRNA ligase subunit beta [Hydrogenobaculum acidophilum]